MLRLLKYELRKTLFSKLILLGITAIAEAVFLVGFWTKKEKRRAGGKGFFPVAPEAGQEDDLSDECDTEQDQLGHHGFSHLIFQKTEHYACTSP